MSTQVEIARIAAAITILRPDWPEKSIRTYLTEHHSRRPFHDLAVAAVWIATDGDTKTPARLAEAGPWWAALTTSTTPTPPRYDPAEAAQRRANAAPPPADLRDQVEAAKAAAPPRSAPPRAGIGAHDRERRPVKIPDAVRRELASLRQHPPGDKPVEPGDRSEVDLMSRNEGAKQ